MDELIGTWEYVSSENDAAIGVAQGFPAGFMEKMNKRGTTCVFEKTGEGKCKMMINCDITGPIEFNFELNKPSTNTMPAVESEGVPELTSVTELTFEGDGVWKCRDTLSNGKVVDEVINVSGETMNITYTCDGVTGSSVYKRKA